MAPESNTVSALDEARFQRRLDQSKSNVSFENGYINHYIITLSGIAFDQAELAESQRNRLSEFLNAMNSDRKCVKLVITSITGYASSPGSVKYNDDLSRARALRTKAHIDSLLFEAGQPKKVKYKHHQTAANQEAFSQLNTHILQSFGERRNTTEADTPGDRRVEIAYLVQMDLTATPGPAGQPRSRYWKIGFNFSSGTGLDDDARGAVGAKVTLGKLEMMDEAFSTSIADRDVTYYSFAVGLPISKITGALGRGVSALTKSLERFKYIKKFTKKLDELKTIFNGLFPWQVPNTPENMQIIGNALSNSGWSAGLELPENAFSGGEFITDTELTFDEILPFHIFEIMGGVSAVAAAESGSMMLLDNSNFFSATIMRSRDVGISGVSVDLEFGHGFVRKTQ
jgi:hypothetical protein